LFLTDYFTFLINLGLAGYSSLVPHINPIPLL